MLLASDFLKLRLRFSQVSASWAWVLLIKWGLACPKGQTSLLKCELQCREHIFICINLSKRHWWRESELRGLDVYVQILLIQENNRYCILKTLHLPTVRETWVQSLDQEDPLEKEMATHTPGLLPGKSHGRRSVVGSSRTWLSDFTSLKNSSVHTYQITKQKNQPNKKQPLLIPSTEENWANKQTNCWWQCKSANPQAHSFSEDLLWAD